MFLRSASGVVLMMLLAACSRESEKSEPVRAVKTIRVETSNGANVREYAADVRARVESRLSFRVGGKLVRRWVEAGQHVRVGQALAQLDEADLRLEDRAALARATSAEAAVDQASADFGRSLELRSRGFVSGAEVERRELALEGAKAQREEAVARSLLQARQAAYATLSANADGFITEVLADVGAVVAAGAPVLSLAHDGARDAVFAVPEDRVEAIKRLLGKHGAMDVGVGSETASPLPATLRELSATADPTTRTFMARAQFEARPGSLGRTATVRVYESETRGAVKLPLSAVFEQAGRSTVWVVEPVSATLRPRNVRVAHADENEVVVEKGLSPGDIVVTAGVRVLRSGQRVTFYGAAALPAGAGMAP